MQCDENSSSFPCVSDFTQYSLEDVRHLLKSHVSGSRGSRHNPVESHWISTDESFLATLLRAEKRFQAGKYSDIKIYIIDTYELQKPTLVTLMLLAMRAWTVGSKISVLMAGLVRHSTRTEWIFWDHIAAKNVAEIDYEAFSRPGFNKWISTIVPKVVEAAIETKTGRGPSMPELIRKMYYSKGELEEMERYSRDPRATRFGPQTKVPYVVKRDIRRSITTNDVEMIWNLVQHSTHQNLLFVWLLSMKTRDFDIDDIARKIVDFKPSAVTENLYLVSDDQSSLSPKVVAYYRPGPGSFNRIDVKTFQDLMLACVKEWDSRRRHETSHP